jgi:16S rRNA (uracil1498-N3)-methyltransferase
MPYFFQEYLSQQSLTLSPEESKHISKSMRLNLGDFIWITDGKGALAKAKITSVIKNQCVVEVSTPTFQDSSKMKHLHLAVAPTKNPDRLEWLVEKTVELGVSRISFIICERSERKQVNLSRLQRIAIAALKQSQGTWLPELKILPYSKFIEQNKNLNADKYIAYCENSGQTDSFSKLKFQQREAIFLIGPEGDFTPQEVQTAKESGFTQISLGDKILRTETAGLFVTCGYLGIL